MTLTDLGNHYQKSKLCNYYVYFFHALASTHKIYTSSAFSNYDIIFTNGEYQKKELEYAELKFKLPKKEIINTGYFFLDNLNKRAQKSINQKRQILFAPSWNYNEINLFNNYSLKIIEELLNNNFKVILRPHSEHYTRSKEVIKKIENKFKENPNFDIDHKSLNLDSLEKSEILITDNSAVVFEFLLIFKRPIIYIDYVDKIHNSILDQIPLTTLDDKFKKIFGNVINITDISDLSNLCEKLLNNNHLSSNKIDIFIKEHFSNFRSSSNFAAEYLIKKSIETDISKDN